MRRITAAIVVGLLISASTPSSAETQPQHAKYAVAKFFTQGCSATCVWTSREKSIFVGCGHGEVGASGKKKHGIEYHSPPGYPQWQPTEIKVSAASLNTATDLSIIEVKHDIPFPYVASVAPRGWVYSNKTLTSCGYDEMKQMVAKPCHVLHNENGFFITRERPWHGRSGGGLIDESIGCLVGVVSGYRGPRVHQDVVPGGPGIYVSHDNIVTFLERHGYGWVLQVERGASPAGPPVPFQKRPEWQTLPPYETPYSTPQQCPPFG